VAAPDGGLSLAGTTLRVGGWVKTGRAQGKGEFAFLELNDGSSARSLQVVLSCSVYTVSAVTPTGTSVVVEGQLLRTPEGTKQPVELKATRVLSVGPCDAGSYPIPKKRVNLKTLRGMLHMRPRTNTLAAVARVRSALAFATHDFFNKHGFLYVHAPLITTSDCEGAGELFQVTTLLQGADDAAAKQIEAPAASELEASKAAVAAKGVEITALKAATPNDDAAIKAAVCELKGLKEEVAKLEDQLLMIGGLHRKADGTVDYSHDFFAAKSFLTCSGQLQAEIYACALSSVYTFGPTFRAENSHTSRHLAEFWMIEPELAFADIYDDMACAEAYVRYCCQYLLDTCMDDMEFFTKQFDKGAIDRLRKVARTPFARCTYTEGIEILETAVKDGKITFSEKVEWGMDLPSDMERYLAEKHFQGPVILYNYPKEIKAFYMRLNDDNKTVAAMDVLVPGVGELVGGSQREERLDVLERRIVEAGLPREPYEWYLDLRRYGSVVHSGFGLGFERLVLMCTGLENIRDVIPFPRWPKNAAY
jgi:asparaginyl-tRNA synthetase